MLIPSEDGYVIFIGVLYMMTHKCMIMAEQWPLMLVFYLGQILLKIVVLARIFSPTTFKWSPGFLWGITT